MIELPEAVTIAAQLQKVLPGRKVTAVRTGDAGRKWVYFKPSREAFERALPGRTFTETRALGRSLRMGLDDGRTFMMDEFGGKVLFHEPGCTLPKKFDLFMLLDNEAFMTVGIQMWGFLGLMEKKDLAGWLPERADALSIMDASFNESSFRKLFDKDHGKDAVKTFFTNGKNVMGIGNGMLQDILFNAGINPKRKAADLKQNEIDALSTSVQKTVARAVKMGGRSCERNIYDKPGSYTALMDKSTVGNPCSACGGSIQKISYLGGSCYLCPNCQI